MIKVSQGQKTDIPGVEAIYERIHDAEEKGLTTTGWLRTVYPTGKTAADAVERGDLFVMKEDGRIVAAAILNQVQVDVYSDAEWKHEAAEHEVMVLHTLVVDPLEKGKGYGRAFVAFYEEYAKTQGCTELRMDTNARNTRARALYRSLGYEEIGIVPCEFNGISGVRLVCIEKHLG